MAKDNPLFLFNQDLVEWDHPPRHKKEDTIRVQVSFPDTETVLLEELDMDVQSGRAGKYRIVASAAKYRADIRKPTGDYRLSPQGDFTHEPKEQVLFSGSITIYEWGKIPGTELTGYDFVRQGRIFIAKPDTARYVSNTGLQNVLYGNASTEESKEKRIDRVLQGYQIQEDEHKENANRAYHRSFELGQEAGESRRY